MKPISYARHRFPPDVIRHAVWLYLRFTLSYRDVEDLLAKRGFDVSNELIRRWVLKFGPAIARNLFDRGPTINGASGRYGGLDWRSANVYVARCRQRRRGSRDPGSVPMRQGSALRLLRR